MNYKIELQQMRYNPRQTTSLHLITGFSLLGVGSFVFLFASTDWAQALFTATWLSFPIVGGVSLVYGIVLLYLVLRKSKWLLSQSNNVRVRVANVVVCALLAIVFLLSQWWLALGIVSLLSCANVFAIFYEKKIRQSVFVSFDESRIYLPATARRSHLEWTEVERVLLRHGIVTIDCCNNVLYQWNTKNNEMDAQEFETFCIAHIELNRSKRAGENW